MADGYAIEAQIGEHDRPQQGQAEELAVLDRKSSSSHADDAKHAGPYAGEMFRQPDLAATLRKLVDAEQQALKQGKSRKEAIYAAYDRFYKGDIAKEIVRGTREQGGLFTRRISPNGRCTSKSR